MNEKMTALLEAADRAEGSKVLGSVQLGMRYRADQVIAELAKMVREQQKKIDDHDAHLAAVALQTGA
jgi:hypothetical protein